MICRAVLGASARLHWACPRVRNHRNPEPSISRSNFLGEAVCESERHSLCILSVSGISGPKSAKSYVGGSSGYTYLEVAGRDAGDDSFFGFRPASICAAEHTCRGVR